MHVGPPDHPVAMADPPAGQDGRQVLDLAQELAVGHLLAPVADRHPVRDAAGRGPQDVVEQELVHGPPTGRSAPPRCRWSGPTQNSSSPAALIWRTGKVFSKIPVR